MGSSTDSGTEPALSADVPTRGGEAALPLATAQSLAAAHSLDAALSLDALQVDAVQWVEAALQSTCVGLAVVSLYENRYIRANAAMAKICGVSLEELFTCDPFSLALRVTHQEDLTEEQRLFGELAQGKRTSYEIEKRYRQPDGSDRWGHLTFSVVYAPSLGEQAVPVKFAVLQIVDITERRELAEALQRKDAEIRHAQKVDGLGRLAAGIAHDFNNLLTVITGHAEVLRSAFDEGGSKWTGPDLREDLAAILAASERAASLTAQLLTHGRREKASPRAFVLSELVGTLQRLLVRTLGSNIHVEHSLQATGAILADQGQIGQAVMNLMLNARDAISDGGHIWLATSDLVVPPGALHGTIPGSGHWVTLSVTDDGHGMSMEVQAQMFEPFFTTREERPGTRGNGLGLATVQRIVEEAGAKIDVKSAPGEGTSIVVYFPLVPHPAVAVEVERTGPLQLAAPKGRGVLVIEDEPAVRSLIATLLVGAHYRVMVARDGEEGLGLLDSEPEPVDLIVTDLIMPSIGGLALARRLQERAQRPRVLFISGYSNHTPAEIAAYGVLLPKPFTPAQLLRSVARILSEDPAS